MYVINSSTNAFVQSVPLPQGSFELPFHGTLYVVTPEGGGTNVTAQSADTLVIWPTGAAVVEGYDIYLMMAWGITFTVSIFGVAAAARVITKRLTSFIGVKEV